MQMYLDSRAVRMVAGGGGAVGVHPVVASRLPSRPVQPGHAFGCGVPTRPCGRGPVLWGYFSSCPGHFISLDIDWLRVGLVAQLGPGSQAQGLCLKWGLGALKELVSSGGQFATVREEAVENEDKHRGEQS